MTAVLELRDVRASYGKIEVLHGVSLTVPEGSIVALLGPNGAGKSTTLRVASGQMKPDSGCVHVTDRHINGATSDKLARAGVCALPEGRGIFPNLTVRENLWMMTYGDVSRSEVEAQAYERFPILKERRGQLAGTMSGGEQQMLAMARALVTNPALLLLDEISMGLAPLIVARLYEIVAQIGASGVSILLVEQFAQTALGVADYAAVMVGGKVRQVGQPKEIQEDLAAAYLGGGH